jgi:hypothetical protein
MREIEQETILSAYIATIGKRSLLEAPHDATELGSLAHSLRQLNEAACNYDLTERAQNQEKSVRGVLERAGLILNHFNRDPRGYVVVYIDVPDGSCNTVGRREHGYGMLKRARFGHDLTSALLDQPTSRRPRTPSRRPGTGRRLGIPDQSPKLIKASPLRGHQEEFPPSLHRRPELTDLTDRNLRIVGFVRVEAYVLSEPNLSFRPDRFKDRGDYPRLAGSLLSKLAEALAASDSVIGRIRAEVQNWKLKCVNIGGFSLDRETHRFLGPGSVLLGYALADAWKRFLKPTHFTGAMFFLDDLHNLTGAAKATLAIRDRFQSFRIEGMNYSVCFSARADYFSGIRSFAEPAVRFYKLCLALFMVEETNKYVQGVLGEHLEKRQELADWLYERKLGRLYFLTFRSRQLLAQARGSPPESPAHLWSGREKFRSDLPQLSGRELTCCRRSVSPGTRNAARIKSAASSTGNTSPDSQRKVCSFAREVIATGSTTPCSSCFARGLKA